MNKVVDIDLFLLLLTITERDGGCVSFDNGNNWFRISCVNVENKGKEQFVKIFINGLEKEISIVSGDIIEASLFLHSIHFKIIRNNALCYVLDIKGK